MVLTALAVVFLSPSGGTSSGDSSTPDTGAPNNADQLSSAVTTSLIVVSVVCAVTIAVVLLYKYRCLKILWGYLIGATALLLGYLSYSMIAVAIYRYNLVADKISLFLFAYNFAIVGAVSIFASGVVQQSVVPPYITQAYLIANSVLAAWQLSAIFNVWTSWALLIALALYDLFAVLTPCGPLKCLVKLLSQDDAPALPGLLYEAPLPRVGGGGDQAEQSGRSRRRRQAGTVERDSNDPDGRCNRPSRDQEVDNHSNNNDRQGDENDDEALVDAASDPEIPNTTPAYDEGVEVSIEGSDHAAGISVGVIRPQENETADEDEKKEEEQETNVGSAPDPPSLPSFGTRDEPHNFDESTAPRAMVPLALAKLYKLPLVDHLRGEVPLSPSRVGRGHGSSAAGSGIVVNDEDVPRPDPPSHTAEELRSLVCVMLPVGGGRIESAPEEDPNYSVPVGGLPRLRYRILDRTGAVRRILVVDEHGKVFQVINDENEGRRNSTASSSPLRSSIRLGLGDFVFYSVLVSLAAVQSFLAFVVCSLVVLSGLGLTLLLLALRGAALPALPISIFLGVLFYVATMLVIEPWVHEIFLAQVYV